MKPIMFLLRGLLEAQALRFVQRRFGGRAAAIVALVRLVLSRRR